MKFSVEYLSFGVHFFLTILYLIAIFVNILGNGIVWKLILRNRHTRSPINIYFLNLSLADMVSAIGLLPYVLLTDNHLYQNQTYTTKAVMCSFIEGQAIFFLGSGVSLFTLCAISYHRYKAIRCPLSAGMRLRNSTVRIICLFVWCVILTLMIPSSISFTFSVKLEKCTRDWKGMHSTLYRYTASLMSFGLPAIFLAVVFMTLRRSSRVKVVTIAGASGVNNRKMRLKTAEKVLISLIINLWVSWSPFLIYWILRTVTKSPPGFSNLNQRERWKKICIFFGLLNGAINPFLFRFHGMVVPREIKNSFVFVIGKLGIKSFAFTGEQMVERALHGSVKPIRTRASTI